MNMKESSQKAVLLLADGTRFEGRALGARGVAVGEVVFHTSGTSTHQLLTTPACQGQILAFTTPLIGNCGVNEDDAQGTGVFAAGMVVRECFMSRYALLYLISKTTNEKFLILLDEPETHFNEHWKRYFLKLLCDVLAQKDTDVFVATHSAMLVSDVKKHELHRFELNDNEIISNDCLLNSYGANIIDIGQILFKMEGNIGERAKDEIEKLLNSNSKKDIEKIERLLSEVGPGEYRWRLRAKLQELMSQKKVTVPVCPLVRKRRKYA